MKHFIQRRFFPVFLCMALALSLTACGGRGNQPAGDKTGDTAGTLSGSKGEKDSGAGVASGSGEETAEADSTTSTPVQWPTWATGSRGIPRRWRTGWWRIVPD